MNKLIPALILIFLIISGCKKEGENLIWERSFGLGTALFVAATADSGLLSCGETGGKPYLIKLDKNKNKVAEYLSPDMGVFSSAWYDTGGYLAAGSSDGKLLLTRFDRNCNFLRDTILTAAYNIDNVTIRYLDDANLLAVGTACQDSSYSVATGLLFIWFDTTGIITGRREIKESSSVFANDVVVDNSGNIWLALTTRNIGSKSKAGVAKYNNQLQKIWEKELYNNMSYGASSLGITLDGAGNVYVSGKTETAAQEGSVNNSFLASLSGNGTIRWKNYLENSNSGSSVIINKTGQVLMLNYNCFIINIIEPEDGSNSGRIRTFNVCDPYNTDAQGFDFDINYDGNILLAGSKGGGFYLALKPPV